MCIRSKTVLERMMLNLNKLIMFIMFKKRNLSSFIDSSYKLHLQQLTFSNKFAKHYLIFSKFGHNRFKVLYCIVDWVGGIKHVNGDYLNNLLLKYCY